MVSHRRREIKSCCFTAYPEAKEQRVLLTRLIVYFILKGLTFKGRAEVLWSQNHILPTSIARHIQDNSMQEEKLKGQAVKILLNFTNKLSSTFAYNGFITKERKDFGGIFCGKNGHVYQHTAISLA